MDKKKEQEKIEFYKKIGSEYRKKIGNNGLKLFIPNFLFILFFCVVILTFLWLFLGYKAGLLLLFVMIVGIGAYIFVYWYKSNRYKDASDYEMGIKARKYDVRVNDNLKKSFKYFLIRAIAIIGVCTILPSLVLLTRGNSVTDFQALTEVTLSYKESSLVEDKWYDIKTNNDSIFYRILEKYINKFGKDEFETNIALNDEVTFFVSSLHNDQDEEGNAIEIKNVYYVQSKGSEYLSKEDVLDVDYKLRHQENMICIIFYSGSSVGIGILIWDLIQYRYNLKKYKDDFFTLD